MMLINPDQPLTLANLMDLNRDEDLPSCKLPFVWKLYEMLEDVATSGNDHIVSWVGKGKGFKVHDMSKFVNKIIPMYFKQSKFKSFQRQLYFYNFKRISSGTEEGGYHHGAPNEDNHNREEQLCRLPKKKNVKTNTWSRGEKKGVLSLPHIRAAT